MSLRFWKRECSMFQPITGRKVRVGVLGAGRWAERAHLPGWTRDPRCEVVAICDADPEMLAEIGGRSSASPRPPTDYREVVSRDDIDVIDVCTPSHTHFELSMAALNAGKHVLCEKPVAFDFRETLRRRRAGEIQGTQDQARLHLPLLPGHALHEGAGRSGLLPARRTSTTPTSRTRSGSIRRRRCVRSIHNADQSTTPRLLARGLRRAGDRHRPLDDRGRYDRRWSAR